MEHVRRQSCRDRHLMVSGVIRVAWLTFWERNLSHAPKEFWEERGGGVRGRYEDQSYPALYIMPGIEGIWNNGFMGTKNTMKAQWYTGLRPEIPPPGNQKNPRKAMRCSTCYSQKGP